MNVQDAAYATVRCYPGGSESLAPRVGMTGAVLRNKVNPKNDRNVLSLADADALMGVTGDHRILHALAAEHGYTLQPIEGDGPGCLMDAVLATSAAKGDLSSVIARAIADKVISSNDLSEIGRACAAVHAGLVAIAQEAAADAARAAQAPGDRL
ncbi:phage regulatory CII family protein [Luteimonas sp. MJ174]|uniref:phage regulatory CII family protein n=1 Tax=Luteimonas sp. MJ174 TaxID=3129237 RepID=UPI0031B9ECC4